MGQGTSDEVDEAWDRDLHTLQAVCRHRSAARRTARRHAVSSDRSPRTSARADRLDDVMIWLQQTELREKVFEDAIALCAQEPETSNQTPMIPTSSTRLVSSTASDIGSSSQADCCSCEEASTSRASPISLLTSGARHDEDMEWDERKRRTGAVGRLVLYHEKDRPQDDFTLRGGEGRRIIVASVTEIGRACTAGVRAGDILVNIDGNKDFMHKSADEVHAGLRAPTQLVFMGFVGKLVAEVRLDTRHVPMVGDSSTYCA